MYKNSSIGFNSDDLEHYEVEAGRIISWLETDSQFCHDFFFGSDPRMCNIAQLRSNMLAYFKRNYQVVVSPKDFSVIVYEALWSDGSWATLRTYEKQSNFFAWLKEVAKNAVLDRLKNEKYIPKTHSRTTGNTRLALRSKPEEMLQLIIDEQLEGSKYHDLMYSIYVDRLSKVEIMVKYRMTAQEFEEAQEEGERELKEALLRTSCWYEKEVLHDKNRAELTVSPEFVSDMEAWLTTEAEENTLADVFGVCLTEGEVQEKVLAFLYDFSAKLSWNERDRSIWRQRFINNASPVVLANNMGKTRAWVDTRYSRLNKELKAAIKEWWRTHGE